MKVKDMILHKIREWIFNNPYLEKPNVIILSHKTYYDLISEVGTPSYYVSSDSPDRFMGVKIIRTSDIEDCEVY